jgi:hypothetical protein
VFVAPISFAPTPATQDAPRYATSPSISLCPRSLDLHRAARVPPQSTRGLTTSLPPFKGPEVLSRGNQPPLAPNFPFPALVCAQSLAGVELRRRRATSPRTATLQCFCAGVVPPPPEPTEALPSAPEPLACPRPRLRRSSATESGSAAAGSQGNPAQSCHGVSGVCLISGSPDLNRLDLILIVRSGSGCSDPSPHRRPCRWARSVSPPRPRAGDLPGSLVSARARARV